MALVQQECINKMNEGWQQINDNAISKLETFLNQGTSINFSKQEYMKYYT